MDAFSPPPPSDDSSWWLMAPELDDAYGKVADQIIEKRGAAKLKPPPEPRPPAPKPPHPLAGLKRSVRDALRALPWFVLHQDAVNATTNRIYKGIMRPALAKAYVLGFEAATETAGNCCGCNTYSDDPINPYDGTAL